MLTGLILATTSMAVDFAWERDRGSYTNAQVCMHELQEQGDGRFHTDRCISTQYPSQTFRITKRIEGGMNLDVDGYFVRNGIVFSIPRNELNKFYGIVD